MSQTIVLSCPNCATRFSAPVEKFMPGGRQVRCSQCQHVWFSAIPSAPDRAAPATITREAAIPASSAAMATADAAAEPQRTRTRRRRQPRRRRAGAGGRFLHLLLWLIALCLLAAILAYIFREPLRRAVPQAAPYIDRYTNTVDHTAQGLMGRSKLPDALEFRNIHYDVKDYDGEKAILVEADLMNTSDEDVPAPRVHIRVVDSDSAPMYATIIGPEDMSDSIPPNQTKHYFVRIPEPPADFDRVLLNIEEE